MLSYASSSWGTMRIFRKSRYHSACCFGGGLNIRNDFSEIWQSMPNGLDPREMLSNLTLLDGALQLSISDGPDDQVLAKHSRTAISPLARAWQTNTACRRSILSSLSLVSSRLDLKAGVRIPWHAHFSAKGYGWVSDISAGV